MSKPKTPFDLEAFKRRIQEEGLPVAFETSLAICKDPKAPAAARSQASANIFRINGYFTVKEPTTGRAPHEMGPDEIADAIGELQSRVRQAEERKAQALADQDTESEEDEDVFG